VKNNPRGRIGPAETTTRRLATIHRVIASDLENQSPYDSDFEACDALRLFGVAENPPENIKLKMLRVGMPRGTPVRSLSKANRLGMHLEEFGFVTVATILLKPPASFVVDFERVDAKAWGPVLYAFRIGGEVVRIGKAEKALRIRMRSWEHLVSKALAGYFQKGGTPPWEAYQWRKLLTEHGLWRGARTRGADD
jgi:hypothetical protein